MILSILVVITFAYCNNQDNKANDYNKLSQSSDSSTKTYQDSLTQLEQQSAYKSDDSLGEIISTILFNVKTHNLADYNDGKIPWIRIDSPQIDIKNLISKDEVVIPPNKITIIIDYPLSINYEFELTSSIGFTRAQLITEISKHYHKLYDEEEKTATIKTLPLEQRKVYNRNTTNGKYGIWGHDIGDLVLDDIIVHKTSDSKLLLTLEIDS